MFGTVTKKTYLFALTLVVGTCLASSAWAQKGVVYTKTSNWAVQKIDSEKETEASYCVMSNQFSEGAILNIAQNINYESSISFDFKKPIFNDGERRQIVLDPGAGVQRTFDALPNSKTAIIVKVGRDQAFFKALKKTGFLRAALNGENYAFNLANIDEAKLRLDNCLFSIPRSSPQIATQTIAPDQAQLAKLAILEDQMKSLMQTNAALAEENIALSDKLNETALDKEITSLLAKNAELRAEKEEIETVAVEQTYQEKLLALREANLKLQAEREDLVQQEAVTVQEKTLYMQKMEELRQKNANLQMAQEKLRLEAMEEKENAVLSARQEHLKKMEALKAENLKLEREKKAAQERLAMVKEDEESSSVPAAIVRAAAAPVEKVVSVATGVAKGAAQVSSAVASSAASSVTSNVVDYQAELIETEAESLSTAQLMERRLSKEIDSAPAPQAKPKKRSESMFRKAQTGERAKDVVDIVDDIDAEFSEMSVEVEAGASVLAHNKVEAVEAAPLVMAKDAPSMKSKTVHVESLLSEDMGSKTAVQPTVTKEELIPVEPVARTAVEIEQEYAAYEAAQRQEPISSPASVFEVIEPIEPAAQGFQPDFFVSDVLERASVVSANEVSEVDTGAASDTVVHQWRVGSVYGSAEQKAIDRDDEFEVLVLDYLQKTEQRCTGDYAVIPSDTVDAGDVRVDTYEIACITDNVSSSASLMFVKKMNTFMALAHEAPVDDMDTAMALRDRLSDAIIR